MDKDMNFNSPAVYRIRLQEDLGTNWTEWFYGFEVSIDAEGGSLLEGLVADQAALHGLIRKVRDLGLTLVSVQRVENQTKEGETV
jgi:hypothetical protein